MFSHDILVARSINAGTASYPKVNVQNDCCDFT